MSGRGPSPAPLTTTGAVLRLQPLGGDSLIVRWCTAGYGVLSTAVRGARKPGSPLAGRLDLFHECELVFTPARSGDLHSLAQAALLSPRLGLRKDLLRLRLASYMASLLLATVEPMDVSHPASAEEPDNPWHRLLAAALDYVAEPQTRLREAILLRFERRMAELHGLYSPAAPPHRTLLRHFQSLPSGRAELLAALRQA